MRALHSTRSNPVRQVAAKRAYRPGLLPFHRRAQPRRHSARRKGSRAFRCL